MTAWTREAVEALGPTTNVPTTAAIIDVDPDTIYSAIRRGEWTATRVLKIGRAIKIPTLDLIRLLFAPEIPAPAPLHGVPAQCQHSMNAQVTDKQPQSQCGCGVESRGAALPLRVAT